MDTSLYAERRRRLAREIDSRGGGIAVISTAAERNRNSDNDHPFRHDSSFHYLTGFDEPGAWLMLAASGESTVFCRAKNPETEVWDGVRLGVEDAPRALGVDRAFDVASIDAVGVELLANQPAVWLAFGADPAIRARIDGWLASLRSRSRSGVLSPEAQRDLEPLLADMRLRKDDAELAIMRRAAQISASAHVRAMRYAAGRFHATPNGSVHEFEIEAELLHEFRRHGAQSPAYPSIVAAGDNACVLHHAAGATMLRAGELCLIDAGCELDGYASDITRTFPANGRYSPAQRELYDIVLAAQKAAIAATRPGARLRDAHHAAVRVLTEGMLATGLLDRGTVGDVDAAIDSAAYRRFYMHGTGHWLGRDVHDVGDYLAQEEAASEQVDGTGRRVVMKPSRVLQPGMVVTIEPGLYVRPADDVPERYWHVGIRIEDDAVVTTDGCELISRGAPVEAGEIEALMAGRGGPMKVAMSTDFEAMFERAPVSFWLEDFSALHALFEQWRADGVTDLRHHLGQHRGLIAECSRRLRVVQVNQKTLTLFEARDLAHLTGNLDVVFGDPIHSPLIDELAALWDGALGFSSQSVNHTLGGRRLDILVNGQVLPGHEATWDRVLVATQDITDRTRSEAGMRHAEGYARGLFEHSPVSLWVEDFSSIKRLLDDVRDSGIDDFRVFTQVHPEFTLRCMQEIRVIDVNQRTLDLFHAPDKATLLANLDKIFQGEMQATFTEQLIDLWQGKLMQQREVVNHSLDGERVHVLLQLSVLPGAELDWSLVQVALIDITARKKAEAYLEYLGTHDVLTKLRNRAYFEDESNRLERKGPWPVTVIAIDLNRLKATNDESGHAAGDALLRRAGEVLAKVADRPCCAARVGGDEFLVLMPGMDEAAGEQLIERIKALVELNNQFYPGAPLSLSMGCASAAKGQRLESVVSLADERMYAAKSQFYALTGNNRRGRTSEGG